jgi:Protein of unknown function (DUF3060)
MMHIRSAALPLFSMAALLVLGAAGHAQEGLAQPAGDNTPAIDCAGGDAAITGDNERVTLRGACRSLTVRGSGNQIRAELAPRARVDVRGDGNVVRYRLIGGTEEARVAVAGQQDVVGPETAPLAGEAAPATRPPLTLMAGAPPDENCTDRDVMIAGDGASYTLHGGCRSVSVTGAGTTVHAEMQAQGRISVPGPNDTVFWFLKTAGADPVSDVTGANSKVLQEQRLGSVIAPPSAAPMDTGGQAPLMLTGGPGVVEERCAGRDAQITADNTVFVLRDRCRSISVTGNGDKVEAELLSGSRIRIVGDHSLVQFVLADTGPDPIVSVSGDQSRAYRIQRLGATSRGDASVGVTPTPGGVQVEGGRGASVTEMPAVPQPTRP